MTPTPERALELAAWASEVAAYISSTESAEDYRDLSAILRAYAEIAPRWQAVLDAEPMVEVARINSDCRLRRIADRERLSHGDLLIIKPTP